MQTRQVRIDGPGVRGLQISAPLLRDLLDLLIEGSRRSLRVRTQGRSTARGALPAWIAAATEFTVQVLEGSTVLRIEAPSLLEAAPEEFRQGDLFPEIDPRRLAVDYLVDSLAAALGGAERSTLYDGQLLRFFGGLDSVFEHGVAELEFNGADALAERHPLRISKAGIARFRDLHAKIPRPQQVKVAGKLNTIRHSDRTFVLELGGGAERIRGIAEHGEDLQALWGQCVLVAGSAYFTASGAVQRVDADSLRPASERDLALFGITPAPLGQGIDVHALQKSQGPRSGLNAIFGKWPGEETDAEIREALDLLS